MTAAADGAPVRGVTVVALNTYDFMRLASATTSATGTYTLTGLAPAFPGVIVCFDARLVPSGATGFASQCYQGVAWNGELGPRPGRPAGATPVGVGAGTTTAGINAALVSAGVISGRVTAAAGGAAVSGVSVDVFDGSGDYLTSATTSAAGTYTVTGLMPGGDIVCFDGSQVAGSATGFASQCYQGVVWALPSLAPGPPPGVTGVQVRAGTRSTGINAVLDANGAISGRVTAAAGGAAVSGVGVYVFDAIGNELGSATTSAAGTYTVTGLPPVSGGDGGDAVCFDAADLSGSATGFVSQCYKGVVWAPPGLAPGPPPGVTGVGVTAGATTAGINAALTPGGVISGRVTAAVGGAAVSGVVVDVADVNGDDGGSATTSAAGTYTMTGLMPGEYTVCFDARQASGSVTGFASQCYKNVAWTGGYGFPAPGATLVRVGAGATTSGIDTALTAFGAISGRVTAAAGGAAVGGVHVDVLDASGNEMGSATTSADGTYFVPGLAPASGGDIVCFDASQASGSAAGFASQCYKGLAWPGNSPPPGVTRVGVSAGTTTAGINAALTPGGAISGRVTAAVGGAPVSGVLVDVTDGSGIDLGSVFTSAAGTYTVTGLPPASGGDIVCFDPFEAPGSATGGFDGQCYKGLAWAGVDSPPPAGVTRVRVSAGTTTTGINAALTASGAISGTVTAAAGGTPVIGVTVEVLDGSGDSLGSATTSADGTYFVPGLAPESGRDFVCFDASQAPGSATGFASQCYKGAPWTATESRPPAGATPLSVRAGLTTAGINAMLTAAGAH